MFSTKEKVNSKEPTAQNYSRGIIHFFVFATALHIVTY